MSTENMITDIVDHAEEVDETEGIIDHLATLSPLQYDQVREDEAKRLGVRVSTLDDEVARSRRSFERDERSGSDAGLRDPRPWSQPVDGRRLLDELVGVVRRYVILPDEGAEVVALWVMHTHLHWTASISPILAITSPSPECGKTTLLELLGALVPRPLPASNITTAALFRAVELWSPTLLVDEADTFIRNSDELRGVLNSGHRRSSAYVVRTVGEDHEPRQFRTWAPKAIALIGKLPETLESRSIEISLRRKNADETVQELRPDRLDHLVEVCSRCARFAGDVADRIRSSDPVLPPGLHGRAADNWRHLISIADLAGGEWPNSARAVALSSAATRTEDTPGIMLLADIQGVFAERGAERLSSTELVNALVTMEDRPWSEWKHGTPLTAARVARLLAPFKIRPTKFRDPKYSAGTRGYELAALQETFERYLPPPRLKSATAPQPRESASLDYSKVPQNGSPVALSTTPNSKDLNVCGTVALPNGGAPAGTSNYTNEDWQALYDERAGIVEYDGGLSRDEAEVRAAREFDIAGRSNTDCSNRNGR